MKKRDDLTEKQEKLAQNIAKGMSYTDAFKASGYQTGSQDLRTIGGIASRYAQLPKVAARIAELKANRSKVVEREFDITVKKLLQTYVEIAFTDPNELISVRSGACRHCYGVNGLYQWKEHEYMAELTKWEATPVDRAGLKPPMPDPSGGFGYRFTATPNPECVQCEGEGVDRLVARDTTQLSPGARHLYQGAQQTKDGLKILFADKAKALDSIGRMLGAFDDKLRVDLQGQVQSLQLTTTDPAEAANIYAQMLAGKVDTSGK